MSCENTNPCGCTDECGESNPCYDNCGCLNPTTFECVTKPGAHANIDVTDGMNGKQVLDAIDSKIGEIEDEILALNGGVEPAIDTKVKVSVSDTSAGLLNDKVANGVYVKKTVINPAGNEKIKFDILPSDLLSSDSDNDLTIGSDNKLKCTNTDNQFHAQEGVGINLTGTGTAEDPLVISTNATIQVARPCFDGIWKNLIVAPTGNANVTFVAGQPKYRYRFDGTIEFKGNITYTVVYGAYTTGDRKQTAVVGSVATTCISASEQAGISDLKGINYIDVPQASADQIVQQYGYIIRKSAQNITIEFQSSFTNPTSKTVVVNFDGAVSHPNI